MQHTDARSPETTAPATVRPESLRERAGTDGKCWTCSIVVWCFKNQAKLARQWKGVEKQSAASILECG